MRADGASLIDWHPDVAAALAAGRPVVALESSVLAQGLPAPANREAAMRMTTAVRSAGAVPAVTAVAGGRLHVGLTDATLEAASGEPELALAVLCNTTLPDGSIGAGISPAT